MADPRRWRRRELPPILRRVWRTLKAPDGTRHRVRVPVYGPPKIRNILLPESDWYYPSQKQQQDVDFPGA